MVGSRLAKRRTTLAKGSAAGPVGEDYPCFMKTILVPVDFSDATTPTITTALALARACEAEIVLMHVVTPPLEHLQYPVYDDGAWEAALPVAERKLVKLAEQIGEQGVAVRVKSIGSSDRGRILFTFHRWKNS